eukprot:TRINITY_DN11333_c0_g1_i8.p1 TRINITY_DN11333_c0_g1~~TRINITY_DN11333_c0_g1_i8.p1  ORF type:complete len:449 (+),score=65.94 TRINITY_DN11333_c0_g1_i8:60-1406(+)
MQATIHIDADSFFVQVECQRRNVDFSLPVVVQQHQDIISMNTKAKAAGIKKHMKPSDARAILKPINGRLLHVYCDPSGRVSYRPYRQRSQAMVALLRSLLSPEDVIEVASIDEVYILRKGQSPAQVTDFVAHIRQQCQESVGVVVSAGVAWNKLLAKLASSAAKPAGMKVLATQNDAEVLLKATPARKLPFLGLKEERLAQLGVVMIADLRRVKKSTLCRHCNVTDARASLLLDFARGRDPRPVEEKGPPRNYSTHTSFTEWARPQFDSISGQATGERLKPIGHHGDGFARFRPFAIDIARELLGRIAEIPGRQPQTMTVVVRIPDMKEFTQSIPFPSTVRCGNKASVEDQANVERLAASFTKLVVALLPKDQVLKRVSVGVTNLQDVGEKTLDAFFKPKAKRSKLQPTTAMSSVNESHPTEVCEQQGVTFDSQDHPDAFQDGKDDFR